jgi:DNA-binding response OmpR family regulator
MTHGRKRTILHVEDDPSLQNLVRIALEQIGGHAVRTAASGERAVELARETAPDLVLLDLDLPGMNGVSTLLALRELPGLDETPVIFLTAATDPQIVAALESLAVSQVISKPFRPRPLVDAVQRLLRGDARVGA